ncbi:hypothetical protein [Nocardioides sp. L-11A]|uniref:hypothetical protein n=1 Tax=Nocardioides sp. L-11A TaxID=3043848 RepID=UPI00249C5092|nr:hypothetical protein QJ852_04710 [Nocardioides sp. L-11A]
MWGRSVDWSGALGALGDAAAQVVSAEPVGLAVVGVVVATRVLDGRHALQPWRSARRALFGPLGLKRLRSAEARTGHAVARRLTFIMRNPDAVDDVALVVAYVCGSDRRDLVAYRTTEYSALRALVAEGLERRHEGLRVRYLLNERWQENRALLIDIRDYCHQFRDLIQARYPKRTDQARFAEAVSAVTGAVVVADLAAGETDAADRVVAWHTGEWHGRAGLPAGARGARRPYDLAVRRSDGTANPADAPRLGEYNGRIPTLIGVEVCQLEGSDGVAIVLETGESDYRSTEPPLAPERPDGWQCKKLFPAAKDPYLQRFRLAEDGTGHGRTVGARALPREDGPRRAVLLNGKIGIISVIDDQPFFVLMARSDKVSNGRMGLGPAAGGVVELSVEGDARDADRFGAVDVMAGIRRELREELGLRTTEVQSAARAVFLATSRTRPRPDRSGRLDPDTGELVATVLAVGVTHLGPEDFARRRFDASPGRGLYESRGLVFVPMGRSADSFAETLMWGTYDAAALSAARPWQVVGEEVPAPATTERPVPSDRQSIQGNLDQAALVAALYASATIFGTQATMDAFVAQVHGSPLWTVTWPEQAAGSMSRVCRQPRSLLEDEEIFDRWMKNTWGHVVRADAFDRDCEPERGAASAATAARQPTAPKPNLRDEEKSAR